MFSRAGACKAELYRLLVSSTVFFNERLSRATQVDTTRSCMFERELLLCWHHVLLVEACISSLLETCVACFKYIVPRSFFRHDSIDKEGALGQPATLSSFVLSKPQDFCRLHPPRHTSRQCSHLHHSWNWLFCALLALFYCHGLPRLHLIPRKWLSIWRQESRSWVGRLSREFEVVYSDAPCFVPIRCFFKSRDHPHVVDGRFAWFDFYPFH